MNRRETPKDDQKPGANQTTIRGRPKPSDLPYGPSVMPILWRLDPAPAYIKTLYTVVTISGLIGLFFLADLIPLFLSNLDANWDTQNGLDPSTQNALLALPSLVHQALHIPQEDVSAIFLFVGAVCAALIAADIMLGRGPTSQSPWPSSWKTANTICYHEMFSEPTRFGRLLRRPGNTLSNAPFLLGSLSVLASLKAPNENVFWWADLEFAIMLFLLAVFSSLWHGSNAPWSQYPDIWSMDSCILYLIIRNVCMGILSSLLQHSTSNQEDLAKSLAGGVCAVTYAAVIAALAKANYKLFQDGYLHGPCPFSARARLVGISNVMGQGQKDCGVGTVAIFAAMPVMYASIPLFVQTVLLQSTGSLLAGNLLARTLCVGWSYRMVDRWVLDGCFLMNYFVAMKPSCVLKTVGAAIVSPTGALHSFTGITLLAAYVHARSFDEKLGM